MAGDLAFCSSTSPDRHRGHLAGGSPGHNSSGWKCPRATETPKQSRSGHYALILELITGVPGRDP
jgi:hypothetical protein